MQGLDIFYNKSGWEKKKDGMESLIFMDHIGRTERERVRYEIRLLDVHIDKDQRIDKKER